MSDDSQRQQFLAALMRPHDPEYQHHYQEYRKMLETRLQKMENKERFGRRLMWGLWILFGALIGVGLLLQGFQQGRPFGVLLFMISNLVGLVAVMRTLFWFVIDRRRADDVRQERRDSMLMEFERQLIELNAKVNQLQPRA